MDFRERYKEALEACREYHAELLSKYELEGARRLEIVFPELKESEDKRIRNEAISIIKQYAKMCDKQDDPCTSADEVISWLEKQQFREDLPGIESCADSLKTEFQKQVANLLASVLNGEHKYTQGFVEWASQSLLGYAKNELVLKNTMNK